MAKGSISMPSSIGGLVRYNEEFKSKFKIKPGTVIILCIIIITLTIILNSIGASLFGII